MVSNPLRKTAPQMLTSGVPEDKIPLTLHPKTLKPQNAASALGFRAQASGLTVRAQGSRMYRVVLNRLELEGLGLRG